MRIGGRLSKKEWQVLSLTAKEYSAIEISDICKISAKTVYGHKRNIVKKMGLYNHIQFSKMICEHSPGSS
ncbi:helix-turn-helix domain-containing protein [Edaphovirga cremea]|uniref:helix-turn-helix domain-containing protein n=1 Tax=Edaphovirga cremea TaxID=2267246 RepID=UPI003989782D